MQRFVFQVDNTSLSCFPNQGAGFGPTNCKVLFDICYKIRQPHQILARGNYWGTQLIPYVSLNRSISGPTGHCNTEVPLVFQPIHGGLPYVTQGSCDPNYIPDREPPLNPNVLGEAADCREFGSTYSETEQFYEGYSALISGEISTGKDALAPLAYDSAEQDTCGYFRAFAGTQVPRQEVWQRPDLPQITTERNSGTEIIVYPQPAGNQIQVDLPSGTWTLELRHASGKVLYNAPSVSYSHSLDMSAFTPGVYLLQAASTTGEIQTLKIIKQ